MLGATIENFGIGIEDQASGVVISAAPTGGEILQNAAQGILVSHADNVVIDSVASEQNGASGIELDHATGVTVRGVPLVQENDGYGLWVHSSTNNQFFNLDAFENKLTGIYVGESATDKLSAKVRDGEPSTENVFLSCGVVQNGGAGIFLDFGDNRNVVSDCTGQSNTDKDAIDGTPACKNNQWIDNSFGTTNRSCIQ
jgi:nitrous oxidase accessory protein NosD